MFQRTFFNCLLIVARLLDWYASSADACFFGSSVYPSQSVEELPHQGFMLEYFAV